MIVRITVLNGSKDCSLVLLAQKPKSCVFLRSKKGGKNRNSPSPAHEISGVGKNVRQIFSTLGDRDLTQPVSILPEKEKKTEGL